MLGAHHGRVAFGRGDDGASGEVVGLAIEAAGALMDGSDGGFVKEHAIDPGDGQVVTQIALHGALVNPFEVTPCDHAGGQGLAAAVAEIIDQVGLAGQHEGQIGLGVLLELGEGVQFGKDFQAQQRGLAPTFFNTTFST